MTRNEFIAGVTEWYDLISFCRDEGCEICNNIFTEQDRDECINSRLSSLVSNLDWAEIRNLLIDIPVGFDFYKGESITDWDPLDEEDFSTYKEDVLNWMDDYWDDEENEECEDAYLNSIEKEPCDESIDSSDLVSIDEQGDISITDLFLSCNKKNKEN